MKSLSLCLLGAIAALVPAAHAHEVWIEDTPQGELVVRFAEYGEDFEKSPGALDMIGLPTAWTPAGDKPTAWKVEKKTDGFLLEGASPKTAAQIETAFSVMGKPGNPEKPARKPFFYARWHIPGSEATTSLNFDIVPTKAGEAVVYFRGKPVAEAKVKFHGPGGEEKELTADAQGLVKFEASKPGFYMLAAAHQREATPGFAGGKPYDVVSHNCSVAWRQP